MKPNEYFELVTSLSVHCDETKKEVPTVSGEDSCQVAQSIQSTNYIEILSHLNPDELWQIYEENKQLANLWELIEPIEEQRLKEQPRANRLRDEGAKTKKG